MNLAEAKGVILEFLSSHKEPGLKLPDGWVGKPSDNWYRLTQIWISKGQLGVELNSRRVLTISGHPSAEIHEEVLRIAGFNVAEWRSIGNGTSNPSVRAYTDGVIEFIAPPVRT